MLMRTLQCWRNMIHDIQIEKKMKKNEKNEKKNFRNRFSTAQV